MVTRVVATTPSADRLECCTDSSQPTKEEPATKSCAHITCSMDTAHFSATPVNRAKKQNIERCVLVTQFLV